MALVRTPGAANDAVDRWHPQARNVETATKNI